MREAVIVAAKRTPIGKAYRGAFNNTYGATLGAEAIRAAVARSVFRSQKVFVSNKSASRSRCAYLSRTCRRYSVGEMSIDRWNPCCRPRTPTPQARAMSPTVSGRPALASM